MLHFTDVAHRFRTMLRPGHKDPVISSSYASALAHEVEERMRAAEALARSEERLRLAMEATSLGTFEWDIAADRLHCSPNVKRQFGFFSQHSLTLESVLSRIHPGDREAVRATMQKAMEASGTHTYAGEFRTLLPDNSTAWIDARGAVIFSDLGTHPQCMIGIVLDITERKMQELRLHRDAEDLGAANRLKDEFLSTLAHKLRNPLAPIRNGLEILALTGYADPTQRRACDMMGRKLRQLVHLVDELLDASLINQGTLSLRKELVPLQTLIKRAVEIVRPQIEAARHELKLDLPEEVVLLEADPLRISQAIANVLENSVRYTPPGGRIDLRVRRDKQGAAIEVIDNGAGIAPALLPHVFEMFGSRLSSDNSRAEGLGVGLALTRALVEMHGGAVHVASSGLGSGSTFRLWLPALSAEDLASTSGNGDERVPLPRRRVLVVDDDPDSADSTIALLRLMGQDVLHATDDASAAQAAGQFRPEMIFATIETPTLDSSDAARGIRTMRLPEDAAGLKRALTNQVTSRHTQRNPM